MKLPGVSFYASKNPMIILGIGLDQIIHGKDLKTIIDNIREIVKTIQTGQRKVELGFVTIPEVIFFKYFYFPI